MEKSNTDKSGFRAKVIDQIIAIRDSGETNMFDARTVQRLANDHGYVELVTFIDEHRDNYMSFIINGREDLIIDE